MRITGDEEGDEEMKGGALIQLCASITQAGRDEEEEEEEEAPDAAARAQLEETSRCRTSEEEGREEGEASGVRGRARAAGAGGHRQPPQSAEGRTQTRTYPGSRPHRAAPEPE